MPALEKSIFFKLEKLGRVRLSQHFYMRQFLYSEIAAAYGILNYPDDPELAIETGTRLCEDVLEPIVTKFGSLVIRSGFRSAKLNDFGNKHGLMCAKNESNFAHHIWDHKDANGHKGAMACIVIPAFVEGRTEFAEWQDLAHYIHENIPYHSIQFFSRNYAFNIGWHEKPRKEIFSRQPKPHWLIKAS
jgi:hypothetical protein